MWLVVFVFWHDRRSDDLYCTFFQVIIFYSRNWCVRIWHDRRLSEIYFNCWSDNSTFFFLGCIFSGVSKNIAGQTTVPFFYGLYFWGVIIGGRILTRAPIMILTKKKVQSSGWPCFLAGSNYNQKKLRPPQKGDSCLADGWNQSFSAGSNYNRKQLRPGKKRYSDLADGWNKSQITVCRVKIRTPIITKLEKLWPEKKGTVVWSTTSQKCRTKHLGVCRLLKVLLAIFTNRSIQQQQKTTTQHIHNTQQQPKWAAFALPLAA